VGVTVTHARLLSETEVSDQLMRTARICWLPTSDPW